MQVPRVCCRTKGDQCGRQNPQRRWREWPWQWKWRSAVILLVRRHVPRLSQWLSTAKRCGTKGDGVQLRCTVSDGIRLRGVHWVTRKLLNVAGQNVCVRVTVLEVHVLLARSYNWSIYDF